MLEMFTKSAIRRKMILLFLYNQTKEFYLSEIAATVETSAGTAKRELDKLLHADLIHFKKKAGLNIYTLNSGYPLLSEVESIVKKTIGVEVELKKELGKIKNISFAFLFGSYAKGGFRSDSDIDLFVIGNIDEDQLFKAVHSVERTVGREISYHIADKNEFLKAVKTKAFHKDILKKYILLIGDKYEFRKFTS